MELIRNKKLLIAVGLLLSFGVFIGVASANNSWGKYHWNLSTEETTNNPLKLGDNLTTPAWVGSLAVTSTDWNTSVLKNQIAAGSNTACNPVLGGVEICNDTYGNNGWLGIAQIWVYRGRGSHIAQALVKVNDTYFNQTFYNTQSWRDSVMCQEVGHTFGLDHQDENFSNANLGTCMDYTNDPSRDDGAGDNLKPNQHDYDTMAKIYAHLNKTDDGGGGPGNGKGGGKGKPAGVGANIDLNNPSAWGQAIKQDAQGNNSLFERDLGNGQVLITHVIWIK